ncbi:protein DEK isoform X1 [Dasypus novemcinctus]|uniref:protein DEK isoform X1 n=1 Tax=Dasypus novemcinctus TaxID=9361 RepID=UPI0026604944|nr:protein DEK isoform X1 [Dasypus novemcinctus]
MSSSAPAAEGEGTPGQPASEKEPELRGRGEESDEDDEDEEEEEEEEEEEKEKSLIVEGKREKKKVERLTMQVSSLQREPFTIAQGKGQKLCEIERIHFFLSKKKTDELRNLHKLLYNRPGTVSSLKKNVGQFSGFPFEKGSVQYKKKEEMLKKFRNAMLKSICEVLDLERSGVNSELVKRILNFLMHPKPSGKPLPKSKKTSSKGSKKERNSSGMARKAKRTKCPEILSDESSSDEDEKKKKAESSDDEDKESEEEPRLCRSSSRLSHTNKPNRSSPQQYLLHRSTRTRHAEPNQPTNSCGNPQSSTANRPYSRGHGCIVASHQHHLRWTLCILPPVSYSSPSNQHHATTTSLAVPASDFLQYYLLEPYRLAAGKYRHSKAHINSISLLKLVKRIVPQINLYAVSRVPNPIRYHCTYNFCLIPDCKMYQKPQI